MLDAIRERHKDCSEDVCHAWDRDVIVRSMVMPCHTTTVLADADRLAKALRVHIETFYTIEDTGYTYLTYTGSPNIDRLLKALRKHEGKP